jgi:hypothetical protein
VSVQSYGDIRDDKEGFRVLVEKMLLEAAATKADVLIMSTHDVDGTPLITGLKSNALAREHIFKGIWTTGVPWSGGSCHGLFYNCSNVAGTTQEYNENFIDPLFGERDVYPAFVKENLLGSKIPFAESYAGGARGDIGSIISAYAQTFQKAYQFNPIQDAITFINDPQEYEYYRSSLAVWEGDTLFGYVSFNAKRRNEGRLSTTVQMQANPAYDSEDPVSKPHIAQRVFPLVDAQAAFVYPSPGSQKCDDVSIANFEVIRMFHAVCMPCLPSLP